MSLLVNLKLFIRDLYPFPEAQIFVGRDNFERTDFDTLIVAVDALADQQPIGTNENFDATAEMLHLGDTYNAPCVLSFLGTGAEAMARNFGRLKRSETGIELAAKYGLTIYNPTAITNVKALTGSQYTEEFEVSVGVWMSDEVVVPTLRIDTPQISLLTETKPEQAL